MATYVVLARMTQQGVRGATKIVGGLPWRLPAGGLSNLRSLGNKTVPRFKGRRG
jgi:hypothetical protein